MTLFLISSGNRAEIGHREFVMAPVSFPVALSSPHVKGQKYVAPVLGFTLSSCWIKQKDQGAGDNIECSM